MDSSVQPASLGMSYRPELDNWFDGQLSQLHFCEVHAEEITSEPMSVDRLNERVRAGLRVQVHSTDLLLMGEWNDEQAKAADLVGGLAQAFEAEIISAHLANGEIQVGPIRSFDRVAYNERSLELVIKRIEYLVQRLGRPLAAENIAYYGPHIYDSIPEINFLNRIASDCRNGILFDVSNYLTNLTNLANGREHPAPSYLELHTDLLAYVHISGGKWLGSTYVDTHGDAIPDEHIQALAMLCRKAPTLKILYERDLRYNHNCEIAFDLRRIADVMASDINLGVRSSDCA
jgi:uncharacterized protein